MKKILLISLLFLFAISPQLANAQDGYSLSFDGVDDYVDIPSNSDLVVANETFSFSSWVKVPSQHSVNIPCLIGGWWGYGYMVYAGGNAAEASGSMIL